MPPRADTLEEQIERARRAWPGVRLSTKTLISHIEQRSASADAAVNLHVDDLFLACACARGDARALAAFEERFMAQVPAHVARIDTSPVFADEVKENLREKLFVAGPGASPKIASYSGRGPLGGWLRVTAIRVAQNLRRKRGGAAANDRGLQDAVAANADPEMAYLKRHYRRMFREVLEAVMLQLPRQQCAVLRLHVVDGLTVRAIAKLHRVNASTITRWIAQTREHIMDETRAILRERLAVSDRELDSFLVLVKSQIDLTVSRVLASRGAGR